MLPIPLGDVRDAFKAVLVAASVVGTYVMLQLIISSNRSCGLAVTILA